MHDVKKDQLITGVLRLNKGGQPSIKMMLIDIDYFKKRNADQNWREEVKKYVGKTVEIIGDIYTYYPEPYEQQTEYGNIVRMTNITSFNLLN